jgi:hypothetical protein
MLEYYNIRSSEGTKILASKLDDISSEEKQKRQDELDRYWTSD